MDQQNNVRIDVVGSVDEFAGTAKEAERELDRLKASSASAGEAMRGASLAGDLLTKAGGAVAGIALTVAGGMAAWATAQIAATFAIKDSADEIGKLSQRMGESVESVSELRYIFGMAGASAEEMGGLMKSLDNKAQDAARGVGTASAAYKAMGISVLDGNGKLKESRALLEEVADKLAGYKDSAAKAALVQDALGGSWVKLIPLLNGGAQGFRDASAEARQLGVVFDEKLTKQSAELNDNLYRIKAAAEGAKIALGSELLPAVTRLSEEFIQGIKSAGGFWAALNMGATLNPFKNTGENLASVRADLAKMESDQKEYGYLDEQRYNRKKAQLDYLKQMQLKEAMALGEGVYSNEGRGKSAGLDKGDAPLPAGKAPKASRATAEKISDYQQLIRTLNDKIAVETLDLQTTEKLTVAEKAFAAYQADLASGRVKLTGAEKGVAAAYWETYIARAKANQEDKAYQSALDSQTEAVLKQRQSLLERIQTAERDTEMYGLTAAQISVVEQARLADAIAIARSNGVSDEQLAVLEEELRLRGLLSDALSAKEGKQYDIEAAKKPLNEMDEYAKNAAKGIQSSMADFLFDPFAEGLDGMASRFGKVLQRMIADAAAAQIARAMFGDLLGSSGGQSSGNNGWVGAAGSLLSKIDWGTLLAANGHAFAGNGPVQAFAAGGAFGNGEILHAPTAFKFASGGSFMSGVAGEAGPEGALPLKRMGNGKLGVYMEGEGGAPPMTINQTIYADSNTDKAQVRRSAASGARSAMGIMNGARRYG